MRNPNKESHLSGAGAGEGGGAAVEDKVTAATRAAAMRRIAKQPDSQSAKEERRARPALASRYAARMLMRASPRRPDPRGRRAVCNVHKLELERRALWDRPGGISNPGGEVTVSLMRRRENLQSQHTDCFWVGLR